MEGRWDGQAELAWVAWLRFPVKTWINKIRTVKTSLLPNPKFNPNPS